MNDMTPAAHAVQLEPIRQALSQGGFRTAEKLAVEHVRAHPRSAQTWVYLGEALLRQGFGNAARGAFDRAWLLDPQASWVADVRQALAAASGGPSRDDIGALLAVPPATVTAAIMTHNNARTIEHCVRSLLDAVDEIVLLDSDSDDGTIESVEHWPKVKVIRGVPLNDDFAGKRNLGHAHFSCDWVMWIDSDESLDAEDAPVVREAAGLFHNAAVPAVLNVCQVNTIRGKEVRDYSMPRMYQLGRGLRYYGRVHEQIVLEGSGLFEGGIVRQSIRIRLHHDGYEPDAMAQKDKLNRNLRLLRMMVEEEPDNPGWMLYYGRETLASGDPDAALERLRQAERLADKQPRFGRLTDILMYQFKIYMGKRQFDLAEEACRRALQADPQFPDALYNLAQAQMRRAAQLLQQSEHRLNQAKTSFATYRGVVTADRTILDWKADLALADLALLTGKKAEAIRRYDAILQRHPGLEAVRTKRDKLQSD